MNQLHYNIAGGNVRPKTHARKINYGEAICLSYQRAALEYEARLHILNLIARL